MEKSKLQVTLRNLLITYILTGILLVVLALALYRFRLKEGQIRLGVNAIYIIACLFGGVLMGKSVRHRRFFWGLLSGNAKGRAEAASFPLPSFPAFR